jgi:hypothetical protein
MPSSVKYRAQNFKPGDLVTIYTGGNSASPFSGVVTHIHPEIDRVSVEWPTGNSQEDPRFLQRTTFSLHLPAVSENTAYDSYQNQMSEKLYGKLSMRIATEYANHLVEANRFASFLAQEKNLNEIEVYDNVYRNFKSYISDDAIKEIVSETFKG